MWRFVRLLTCVAMIGSLSAIHGIPAVISRVAVRRTSIFLSLDALKNSFKADVVIGMQESFFPHDPFLFRPLTTEEREFEETLAQRRRELGLSPVASKR